MGDLKMDTFWTRDKIKEVTTRYASDTHPSGDGDQPQRTCRLCASERGLRGFCDARGERYDHLVYQCFGVVVTPSDSMICERCVRQLRSTERFKALVEAAFETTPSELSSVTCVAQAEPETLTIKPPIQMKSNSREIISHKKPKKVFKDRKTNPAPVARKHNIACTICKQRYPMLVPSSGWSAAEFVCSRCKINQNSGVMRKCNLPPTFLLNQLGSEKGDGRRHRLLTGTALKAQQKNCENVIKYHREPRKYHCSQCTLKFILPKSLAEHINSVHKDSLDTSCIVCGKDLKTQAKLEKHIKIHTGELHQCEICMRIFKSKHALQTHLISHKKQGL